MKKLKLTKGKFTLVDNKDYEWLNQFKWLCSSTNYATRIVYLGGGRKNAKRKTIKMHRLIMEAPVGMEVDHINGDRLDNRRVNLRLVFRSQNQHNRKIGVNNTSGYKGVGWHKPTNRWQVRITLDSKQIRLGYYADIEKAKQVYNQAAAELFGEYARLNK